MAKTLAKISEMWSTRPMFRVKPIQFMDWPACGSMEKTATMARSAGTGRSHFQKRPGKKGSAAARAMKATAGW